MAEKVSADSTMFFGGDKEARCQTCHRQIEGVDVKGNSVEVRVGNIVITGQVPHGAGDGSFVIGQDCKITLDGEPVKNTSSASLEITPDRAVYLHLKLYAPPPVQQEQA